MGESSDCGSSFPQPNTPKSTNPRTHSTRRRSRNRVPCSSRMQQRFLHTEVALGPCVLKDIPRPRPRHLARPTSNTNTASAMASATELETRDEDNPVANAKEESGFGIKKESREATRKFKNSIQLGTQQPTIIYRRKQKFSKCQQKNGCVCMHASLPPEDAPAALQQQPLRHASLVADQAGRGRRVRAPSSPAPSDFVKEQCHGLVRR